MVSSLHRLLRQVSPKFHITTPIFYPNAKPHLGHLYSSLLCDVQARWNKMKREDVLFTTGTDEHGLKIQLESEKRGFKDPNMFVDELYPHFVVLNRLANIQHTRFIRTTDSDHIANVRKLWNLCNDKGYIYKSKHCGWYSVSDETFYPGSKVVKLINGEEIPLSGDNSEFDTAIDYINTETRNKVIYQHETNYFFKLSSLKDALIDLLMENPGFIFPASKHKQVLSSLKNDPLPDLSISRPSSRLQWGIPVPHDESQCIYVWFDALCNYVSSIGGVDALLSNQPIGHLKHDIEFQHKGATKEIWTNTTHLVGKDIIKFHTVYWPAILLAAGLPLPNRVVVHGHWLSQGVKMSKSLGNVVDPLEMIKVYEADPLRWYLLGNSTIEDDGDFAETTLSQTRQLLSSKWGNLIHRCGGTKFNVKRAVRKFYGKSHTSLPILYNNSEIQSLLSKLSTLVNDLDLMIQNYETANAVRHIWSIINHANNIVQLGEPWAKPEEEQDLIIYIATEAARIASIVSQPLIPVLSNVFLDRLDVEAEKRSLDYAVFGADSSYGSCCNIKGREVPLQRNGKI
ncbi:methionine--tRNA ligase MSM1 Ecym_4732 [Eremothecium cymbalariae DBVPG|uniref:Methionine--tRNA ligase, mitochondrial n=1 Tax=Eremothecium cymbalariae (strain CBS 270.75 / DBVPG 7215 / KCTC 17166 / NRRL Y-17582) TaxID=931890 RepID=G8JSM8_ERECY|nr:hypothetical protein Ecym_4732 [Eremothecium cymbalariae DBVPG\